MSISRELITICLGFETHLDHINILWDVRLRCPCLLYTTTSRFIKKEHPIMSMESIVDVLTAVVLSPMVVVLVELDNETQVEFGVWCVICSLKVLLPYIMVQLSSSRRRGSVRPSGPSRTRTSSGWRAAPTSPGSGPRGSAGRPKSCCGPIPVRSLPPLGHWTNYT